MGASGDIRMWEALGREDIGDRLTGNPVVEDI